VEPGFHLVEDRHGEVFTCLLAQLGAVAGDIGFYVVELGNPPEGLLGNWRFCPLEFIE
jgi:hypothetical protein